MNNDNSATVFIKTFFHSFSQVVLLENVISGVLILAGIAVFDLKLAILAVIAALIGNTVAYLMTKDVATIQAGLFGFNPVLVGVAAGVFFPGWDSYIVMVIGALLVTPLAIVINNLCARLNLPGFTLPFIVMTWFAILYSFSMNLVTADRSTALIEVATMNNSMEALVIPDLLVKGIGEIFLLDSVWSSLLILAAFVIANWQATIKVVLAIALTIALGYVLQVNFDTLTLGLITYNSILTTMAIETFSKTKGGSRVAMLILGVVFTFLTDLAFVPIMGIYALPTLTFPFVLVAWGMLYLEFHTPAFQTLD